jgi:hypothetical protein
MCTVTFIPGKGRIVITSNRDEKLLRKQAIPPMVYQGKQYKLIYPKDPAAGGSWIGLKENGDAAVLLNGGFLPHQPLASYARSRGLIFLDVLAATRPVTYLTTKLELNNIEPFTLVIFENNSLYEFRWDGEEKHCRQLSVIRPHIWSSVTLYNMPAIKKRESWFNYFMNKHPNPTQHDILNFHRFTGDGDTGIDLLMRRDGIYSTVSITSMLLTADRGSMKYCDLGDGSITEKKIEFISSIQAV